LVGAEIKFFRSGGYRKFFETLNGRKVGGNGAANTANKITRLGIVECVS